MTGLIRFTFLVTAVLLFNLSAQAQFLVVEGRLSKAGGFEPIEASAVTFRLEVLSPGSESCVLYRETHAVNMTASRGYFNLKLGNGTQSGSNIADTTTIEAALENGTPFAGLVCQSGTTYTPAASSLRKVRISYNDNENGWQTLSQTIDIANVAYAVAAKKLKGIETSRILLNRTTSGYQLSQANLESLFTTTNYTELLALLAGTSTQYLSGTPSANLDMNSQKIVNVTTPTDPNDAANKSYTDSTIGGHVVAASLATLSGAEAGHALLWNGTQWTTGAGTATDSTKLPLTGGVMSGALDMGAQNITNANNISATSVTSTGTISATGALSTGTTLSVGTDASINGNLTVTGTSNFAGATTFTGVTTMNADLNLNANLLASGGLGVATGINSDGDVSIHNQTALRFGPGASGATNYVGFRAPAAVGSDMIWTLPSADGDSGQVLTTDGAGNLSWSTAGGVTSVFGRTGTVAAQTGDYTGAQINFTPSGDLTSVHVQGALYELDAEKASLDDIPSCTSAEKLQISAPPTYTWSCVQEQSLATSVQKAGDTMTGDLQINYGSGLTLRDSSIDSVRLRAPSTVTSSYELVFPSQQGANGQVMSMNASSELEWVQRHMMFESLDMNNQRIVNLPPGSPTTPSLSFNGDVNTGIFRPGTGSLAFSNGGNETMRINPAGNVGIGLMAPISKLDVAGAISSRASGVSAGQAGRMVMMELDANGTEYVGFRAADSINNSVVWALPPTDGAPGETMVTNGSGILSWMTPGQSWSQFPATQDIIGNNFQMTGVSRVGINTGAPRTNVRLDVMGSIATGLVSAGSSYVIDFSLGNVASSTMNCGNFLLYNLTPGGRYTLVVKGTVSSLCTFSAYTDGGVSGLSVSLPLSHGQTIGGSKTIYHFTVLDNEVFVEWASTQ